MRKNLILFPLLLSALLVTLIATGAQATTWNVPGDFSTIQAAINSSTVKAGDTIVVGPGTYHESLSWLSKNLILQGAGAGISIIDPSTANGGPGGNCILTRNLSASSSLSGFTLQNG